jgi:hypothetical protein
LTARDIRLKPNQFQAAILPLLVGRVFHVTTRAAYDAIVVTGEIKPNFDGVNPSPFGSRGSFFRKRGCVSLFDLRAASATEIDDYLCRCHPLQAGERIVFLFLARAAWNVLIPWTQWQQEQAWSEIVVPHVEAGYLGPIPVPLIDEVLTATIDVPTNPLIEALSRGRRKRGGQSDG